MYVRGQIATFRESLISLDGTRASFTVKDPDGGIVFSGFGEEESMNVWAVTFTIPDTAPVGQYTIRWVLSEGRTTEKTTRFEVVDFAMDEVLSDKVLTLDDTPPEGTLHLDAPATDVQSVLIFSNIKEEAVVSGPTRNGKYFTYTAGFTSLIDSPGMNATIMWRYRIFGTPEVQTHTVYALTARMFPIMQSIRDLLDQAKNHDINPNLRLTDDRIAQAIYDGMGHINSAPPRATSWTIRDFPPAAESALVKTAAWEALVAYRLAEGYSAFDFQGASTQLTVDRTPHLDAAISQLEIAKDKAIETVKRISPLGTLNVSVGPHSNRIQRVVRPNLCL